MQVTFDDNIKKLCKKVALELNIPEIVVTTVYYRYIKTLKSKIEGLPLKPPFEEMDEESFNKLIISFNIRFIGKIYTTHKMYKGKRKGWK